MKAAAILTAATLAASPAAAELITKTSPHSVPDTVAKLVAAVENAGATVVAQVDHAAAAERVDLALRPTVMVMFGNPKLGTPAMQAAQAAGLDLPLRVVVYEGEDGQVTLAYHDPAELTALGVPADAEVIQRMTGALDNLTNAAIAE